MRLHIAVRLVALGCCALAGAASAQVGLPSVRLPQLGTLGNVVRQTTGDVTALSGDALTTLRRTSNDALIRNNRQLIEADPNGAPILRGELLALNLTDAQLAAVLARGFALLRQQGLEGLDTAISVLRVPDGMSTRRALAQLRMLEPEAEFDYDHLYSGSAAQALSPSSDEVPVRDTAPPAASAAAPGPVGLIDGGIQADHPALRAARISTWGCEGRQVPSAHGTAVASLLVGDAAPFQGAAVGAQLYAADVYCGVPTGGAMDSIAAAFGWLSAQRIGVINISLVGPDNLVLRAVVRQMIAHGHLIVAAVGNDGPAAPPLYPAAYPQVIGVTAVDAHRRVLLEAERGAQVMFAAPGADMAAALMPRGYASVRGTSFAAPLVAGLLAAQLHAPDPAQAPLAVAALARAAIDLGSVGRDSTYGLGLVGESLRCAPNIIQARATLIP